MPRLNSIAIRPVFILILSLVLGLSLRLQLQPTSQPEPTTGPILTSVVITAAKTTLTPGDTVQLTVTAAISDGTSQNVTASSLGTAYESSNTAVASVDASGLVTAVSKGTAAIFASNTGVSASITLDVKTLLNDECIATILNRQVQVSPDGTFALGNVPVPVGAFRARIVCQRPGETELGASAFVQGVPNGDTQF